MGCKGTDRKYTCGSQMNARCVEYDLEIPECSDLSGESCLTIEDTTGDTYSLICKLNADTDLSALGNDCIDYEEEVAGKIKVNEALKKHEEMICELQNALPAGNCPIDISCMNLDTSCLEDTCGTGFNTLEDLLQAMINKICTL